MGFYHHVLIWAFWVSKRFKKRIYFTILDIDVTVLSFCWSAFDHLQTPLSGHHSKVIPWLLFHWMKPADLVDHQGTFVHFRAILDAAIVFAMLTLGKIQGQWWNFWKCKEMTGISMYIPWLVYSPSIAGIFHMSTYGYPARNWQKSIAPEAIVQVWKSSRNHMGRAKSSSRAWDYNSSPTCYPLVYHL